MVDSTISLPFKIFLSLKSEIKLYNIKDIAPPLGMSIPNGKKKHWRAWAKGILLVENIVR